MRPTLTRPTRAGFSLTELSLGMFMLGSMVLMAGLATDRCLAMLSQQRAEQKVTAAVGRALQRIAGELEFAGIGAMGPKPVSPWDTETLSFRSCAGYDAGAVAWGVERTLRFEYEVGEADDGQDNNGNGLIDEGLLVRIDSEGEADEQRVVLAHGVSELLQGEVPDGDDNNGNGLVDEHGLSFFLEGEVVTVRLSLQAVGPLDNVITKTLETSVFVRN